MGLTWMETNKGSVHKDMVGDIGECPCDSIGGDGTKGKNGISQLSKKKRLQLGDLVKQ